MGGTGASAIENRNLDSVVAPADYWGVSWVVGNDVDDVAASEASCLH